MFQRLPFSKAARMDSFKMWLCISRHIMHHYLSVLLSILPVLPTFYYLFSIFVIPNVTTILCFLKMHRDLTRYVPVCVSVYFPAILTRKMLSLSLTVSAVPSWISIIFSLISQKYAHRLEYSIFKLFWKAQPLLSML